MRVHSHRSNKSSSSRRSFSPLPARKPVVEFLNSSSLKKTKSRVVVITSKKLVPSFARKQRYAKFKKSHFSYPHSTQTFEHVCPNAPHNTTSYLMNFHRDEILNNHLELDRSWISEDEEDLPEYNCYAYGSFLGSADDSYEVQSQISPFQ
jgi:hypothetical protein